jgi:hypothetical protein
LEKYNTNILFSIPADIARHPVYDNLPQPIACHPLFVEHSFMLAVTPGFVGSGVLPASD